MQATNLFFLSLLLVVSTEDDNRELIVCNIKKGEYFRCEFLEELKSYEISCVNETDHKLFDGNILWKICWTLDNTDISLDYNNSKYFGHCVHFYRYTRKETSRELSKYNRNVDGLYPLLFVIITLLCLLL